MTVVETVSKLYDEIKGSQKHKFVDLADLMTESGGVVVAFCGVPIDQDEPPFQTWLQRCRAIGGRRYSRRRDEKRAYKRADLALARAIDADNAPDPALTAHT